MRSQNRPCSDSRAATQRDGCRCLLFIRIFVWQKWGGGNLIETFCFFADKSLFTWGSGRGGGGLAPVEFGPWDEQACQSDSADAAHGDDDVGDCNNDHNKDQILEITTMSRNSDWHFVKTISQTFVCSLVMFRQSWRSKDIHNPPGRNPNC